MSKTKAYKALWSCLLQPVIGDDIKMYSITVEHKDHTYVHTHPYIHGVYIAPFYIDHDAEMELKIKERKTNKQKTNNINTKLK